MLQTTIICGAGLLVFVVSPFVPIARFGLVMAIMLALGLIGDLVLLPAALCSSLGSKMGKKLAVIGDANGEDRTNGNSL